MSRPLLTLDFDGVLHSYESGWKGADVIPDSPVPGAIEFLRMAVQHFRVAICSSRCVAEGDAFYTIHGVKVWAPGANMRGIGAMIEWLEQHGLERHLSRRLEFWVAKPPSHLMIDDRALRFDGDWGKLMSAALLAGMHPWNHGKRHP